MLLLYHRLRIRACLGREATQSGPPSPRTDPSFSPLAAEAPDLRPRRRQTADTGLAAGHAPRRAGPEPGAAALVGRDRGRHHDRNHHRHPPATPGKAQGLSWRYYTLTATTLRTHGPPTGTWVAHYDPCR